VHRTLQKTEETYFWFHNDFNWEQVFLSITEKLSITVLSDEKENIFYTCEKISNTCIVVLDGNSCEIESDTYKLVRDLRPSNTPAEIDWIPYIVFEFPLYIWIYLHTYKKWLGVFMTQHAFFQSNHSTLLCYMSSVMAHGLQCVIKIILSAMLHA
jgi:hypothetical protein